MIIFEGQISGECKKGVFRRDAKIAFICGLITSIIFAIPTVVVAVTVHWLALLFFLILIPFPFLATITPNEKDLPTFLPSKVTIDTKVGEITAESSRFCTDAYIDDVVKVLDYGEWYLIDVGDRDGRFICQKDLLTSGTLEEFETIFGDKIQRI